ncbi:MAG: AbrB/MazE/SpoVT family DNA-binding domain-containing protein [Clostridia bacterium]|nr:AbrB/MazE/SpoVT family DNA-binding domain-containing protein [Clostridia bacterium]
MQATIQRWGNSQGIRLPKSVLTAAHLCENDAVSIDVQSDRIILRKIPQRRTLDDLFADYHGDYVPSEIDTGADVGLEVFD